MGEIVLKEMTLTFTIFPVKENGFCNFNRRIKDLNGNLIWEHMGNVDQSWVTVENINDLAEQMRSLPFWNIKEFIMEYK